ncbi:MazG-like family protein [Chryseobacterium phage MA9V-2]|nr:MazG-like family protein [Chryseobacterium phage MA9V-2]
MTKQQLEKLEDNVIKWADARNMFDKDNGGTITTQLFKLVEEQGEAFSAKLKNKTDLLKDGTGDQKVCLINMKKLFEEFGLGQVDRLELWEKLRLLQLATIGKIAESILTDDVIGVSECIDSLDDILKDLAEADGLDFLECLGIAYDEIKDRKGKMVNRTFVKESDL